MCSVNLLSDYKSEKSRQGLLSWLMHYGRGPGNGKVRKEQLAEALNKSDGICQILFLLNDRLRNLFVGVVGKWKCSVVKGREKQV